MKINILLGLLVLTILVSTINIQAVTETDDTAAEFNLGTLTNVEYNQTLGVLRLETDQTSGTFISRAIDSTATGVWNVLKWFQGSDYGVEYPSESESDSGDFHVNLDFSSNCINHYRFNNDASRGESGTNATGVIYDYCNNYNLTTYSTDSTLGFESGIFDNSAIFDGDMDRAESADYNMTDLSLTRDISVAYWIYFRDNDYYGAPVRYGYFPYRGINATDSQGIWSFSLRQGVVANYWEQLFFRITLNTTTDQNDQYQFASANLPSTFNVSENKWHHIVGTFNGSVLRLYVDGIERSNCGSAVSNPLGLCCEHDNSGSCGARGSILDGTTFEMNNDVQGNLFVGVDADVYGNNVNSSMDELLILNKVLTDSEIREMYNRGLASKVEVEVRSCDNDHCSGESWVDITDTSPQTLSLLDKKYLQYKLTFASDDAGASAWIYNVSVDFSTQSDAQVFKNNFGALAMIGAALLMLASVLILLLKLDIPIVFKGIVLLVVGLAIFILLLVMETPMVNMV